MKLPKLDGFDFRKAVDEFRTLNPKDVGAWPLLPRITALVMVFILALVVGWFLLLNDELNLLSAKQQEEEKLKADFISKKRQAVNLDLHVEQLNEINRTFGALLKQLPNKSEVESLLVEISQSGLGRGLQFELFKPGQEVMKEFYAELPISVRLIGGYHEFGAFSSDIGALSRIVTLGDVAISTTKDGALVMETIAKTFRYLDEEEIAKQKKAAAEAKKKAAKK